MFREAILRCSEAAGYHLGRRKKVNKINGLGFQTHLDIYEINMFKFFSSEKKVLNLGLLLLSQKLHQQNEV